ncbi:MAG: flavin reductase [Cyanobacteriota bacterium]
MKELKFNELSRELLEQLTKGAFLTVKDKNNKLNTMTIAWGTLGYMWMKPVFMAMVRNTRYTFPLIENSDEFTVSFPLKGSLSKELMVCGTKSGKDIDKFKECNLEVIELKNFTTPVIAGCDLHLLCKILHKQALDPQFMCPEVLSIYDKDYHSLYFGELIHILLKE